MKNLIYTDGPPKVKMGVAGAFKINEPKDVDDKLAGQLLKKKTIVFKVATAEQIKAAEDAKKAAAAEAKKAVTKKSKKSEAAAAKT